MDKLIYTKVNSQYALKGAVVFLALIYFASEILQYKEGSIIARAIGFPCFVFLFWQQSKIRHYAFAGFIISFALAEPTDLLSFLDSKLASNINHIAGNTMYVMGYTFLTIYLHKQLNYKEILRKLWPQLIALTACSIYLYISLAGITNIDKSNPLYMFTLGIEIYYNVLVVLIFVLSFLSYLLTETQASFLLFISALMLVFSEILVLGYLYISAEYGLRISQTFLFILAFFLFYRYFTHEPHSEVNRI